MFTPEELEELRRFDAEIDAQPITMKDYKLSREIDHIARTGEPPKPQKTSAKRQAYQKAYYAANRERILEYGRRYKEEHREERRLYFRAYHTAYRERHRENQRRYYAAHREEILEKQRIRYQKRKEAAV